MLFLSPRFFHSSFIHSTGTFGLPFSTAPQQHPRQSDKCAMTMRFVCMEKLAYGTILPSWFLQIFVTAAWPSERLAGTASEAHNSPGEGAGNDESPAPSRPGNSSWSC